MKKIIILAISIYQIAMSPILKTILGTGKICRFSVSCSDFAKDSIEKYGILEGGKMFMARFVKCQPFAAFN